MRLKDWMEALPRGELSRLAREHGIRAADFYEATADAPAEGERDTRPKTVERAKRIAAATDGAVSWLEVLGEEPDGRADGDVSPSRDVTFRHSGNVPHDDAERKCSR